MSNTRVRGAATYWPPTGLLGRVGEDDRRVLLGLGHGVVYPAGQITIHEADTSDFALLLTGGTVKVTAHAQDGREALLAVRMAGDLVGELAGIDGQPRIGTVTACGRVLARYVLRAELLDCTKKHPAIGLALNASVVAKLRTATGRIVDFTGCDVLGRLARILHHLAVSYGRPGRNEAQLPLSQPEMATLVGAAESSIHKALRALRESGAVTTGYRRITILDLDHLARIAAAASSPGISPKT
ncbi:MULTISPECIES: Crp/Fnr family transcriptional regulator [unclassified Kitasatospora]|uniref:Crp/Fnr family transcriptional regulator n=1 Tax=unclassified Kitasatospora TaxID=2633591 RepID=UPI00070F4CBA|nr:MULTISPECIES: Crp/Fnr family transcriptional regulator [unclassified Kitasatospora]KQV22892.1 Crp/Fnr family transcriptional regulator [Kitasatospora sp. Root107]KRB61752.1 Crp/Fnr family transcriptional regulator [Kitasatospora sp. Root187]